MPYKIILSNVEDLNLLKKMFKNAMAKVEQGNWAYQEKIDSIQRINQALSEASPTQTKTAVIPKHLAKLCPDHPEYGAQRAPRKDCKKCWAAYKSMNPLAYDAALARWKRKSKNA